MTDQGLDNNYLAFVNTMSNSLKYNTQKKSDTLPASSCSNGSPVNKYQYYGGPYVLSREVLYSIYESYQTTFTPSYLSNKYANNTVYQEGYKGAPAVLSGKGPANIFIIRHGEKTTPNYCLNNNGIYRSCEIPDMINWLGKNGYPIDYLVTCNPKPFTQVAPSTRPEQTIFMSSFLLNIPLFVHGDSRETDIAAAAIMTKSQYDGANLFISWEHTNIQALVHYLTRNGWAKDRIVFDHTLGSIETDLDTWWDDNSPCEQNSQIPYTGTSVGEFNTNSTDANGTNNLYTNPPAPATASQYYNDADISADLRARTKYMPYWNDYNFDTMIILNGYNTDTGSIIFNLDFIKQPLNTCYSSCDLNVCMFQPPEPSGIPSVVTQVYSGEKSCEPPTDNKYPSKYTLTS